MQNIGFELKSNLREIDTYYSRPDVDFMQTVECLRIRQRDSFAEVTYKPATTAATHTENNVIIKPETNLPIQPRRCSNRQAATGKPRYDATG
ncbi:CYTH domain-containing protein [Candidatus Minimicrobia naudis]